MVLLHVKQSEDQHFLFECRGANYVDLVIQDIVSVHNLQLKIAHLKEEGDKLAQYGPYKDPKRNEDYDTDSEDEDEKCSSSVKQRGPFFKRDPSYKCTREACDPEVAKKLNQALAEAELCASKAQVSHQVPLTLAMLKDVVATVRGAVMICYPMGLPDYDPFQRELVGPYKGKDALDPDSATMWWAGKEFKREKRMLDHLGKNEKTKVIVKFTSAGHGTPAREPSIPIVNEVVKANRPKGGLQPVDEETQKAMMAWYYKKQEEQKRLQLDDDDTYCNSEWADPKALKSALHRMGKVKMR